MSPEDTHSQASSHTWSHLICLVAPDSIFRGMASLE